MHADEPHHPTPHFLLQAAILPIVAIFLAHLVWLFPDRPADYVPEHGFPFDQLSFLSQPPVLAPGSTVTIDIKPDGTVSIDGVLTEPATSFSLLRLRQHLRTIRAAINRQGGPVSELLTCRN